MTKGTHTQPNTGDKRTFSLVNDIVKINVIGLALRYGQGKQTTLTTNGETKK